MLFDFEGVLICTPRWHPPPHNSYPHPPPPPHCSLLESRRVLQYPSYTRHSNLWHPVPRHLLAPPDLRPLLLPRRRTSHIYRRTYSCWNLSSNNQLCGREIRAVYCSSNTWTLQCLHTAEI